MRGVNLKEKERPSTAALPGSKEKICRRPIGTTDPATTPSCTLEGHLRGTPSGGGQKMRRDAGRLNSQEFMHFFQQGHGWEGAKFCGLGGGGGGFSE